MATETEIERWYRKTWETKGTRFIAARRLKLHENISIITVNLLPVYILALNLLELFPESKRPPIICDNNITYITICLSILLLVVSLIISSKNFNSRAEKLHECGRRISDIHDSICLMKSEINAPISNEIDKIRSEYKNILDKYENHAHFDYLVFKSWHFIESNDDERKKNLSIKMKIFLYPFNILIIIAYYIFNFGLYFIFILSPIILFIL